jgi:peroxiredoxin
MESSGTEIRFRKRTLYIMLAAVVLAVSVILAALLPWRVPQQNTVSSQAANFTLTALDGTEVSLSQFGGQPVLINFWASWCIPCRDEMPELIRAYEAHKAEGLMILGVNLTYSDSLPNVQKFVDEFNITFPVLLDTDGSVALRLYQIPGIPTSVFIHRDGTIARIQVGVMNARQIDQFVGEILK